MRLVALAVLLFVFNYDLICTNGVLLPQNAAGSNVAPTMRNSDLIKLQADTRSPNGAPTKITTMKNPNHTKAQNATGSPNGALSNTTMISNSNHANPQTAVLKNSTIVGDIFKLKKLINIEIPIQARNYDLLDATEGIPSSEAVQTDIANIKETVETCPFPMWATIVIIILSTGIIILGGVTMYFISCNPVSAPQN
jgi:hypothetical protein